VLVRLWRRAVDPLPDRLLPALQRTCLSPRCPDLPQLLAASASPSVLERRSTESLRRRGKAAAGHVWTTNYAAAVREAHRDLTTEATAGA